MIFEGYIKEFKEKGREEIFYNISYKLGILK